MAEASWSRAVVDIETMAQEYGLSLLGAHTVIILGGTAVVSAVEGARKNLLGA